MSSRKPVVTAIIAVGVVLTLARCGQMMVEPVLDITAKPRAIDAAGQKATLTIAATDNQGKPGTGKVTVTSSAGSLSAGEDVVLAAGAGEVEFDCVQATDAKCNGKITITATWTTNGKKVESETSITVTGAVAVDAGTDAGAVDSGVVDAGMSGFSLTADKNKVFKLLGDSAKITATLSQGGTPIANQPVTFTTDLGAIGAVTGVPTTASYMATTDSQGRVEAKFVETGVAGTAHINATAMGLSAMTNIEVLGVKDITFVSGECGAVKPCSTMGSRGSGYNETNTLKFLVTDTNSMPVSGVSVTFAVAGTTLADGGITNNAPFGLTVMSGSVKTDNMGIASGVITSGTGIGSFAVKATVVAGLIETITTPLVIRASKPSNRGLTIACDQINLSTYINNGPPPKQLTSNCTISVSDRQGSPVVSPVTVKLFSEVGDIPATVTTAGGTATFVFTAKNPWPAQDTTPFAADPNQHPFPRLAEPSYSLSGQTFNPRDGLVTIIAQLSGEEYFDDANGNGVGDTGEQFYDQGEAFVDRNDNDQFDATESYSDDAPSNSRYDAANGRWDSSTTIWTSIRLLMTGDIDVPSPLAAPRSRFGVASFGTLPVMGLPSLVPIYACDARLNHLERGTMVSPRVNPGARGAAVIRNDNSALDGYGFGLEQNLVLNATGTGPCDQSASICSFFTRFTTFDGACFIGNVEISPATSAQSALPDGGVAGPTPMSVSIDISTRGNAGTMTIGGQLQ